MADDVSELREAISRIEVKLDGLLHNGLPARVSDDEEFRHHLNHRVDGILHWLTHLIHSHERVAGDAQRDRLAILDYTRDLVEATISSQLPPLGWRLQAERLLASDSDDHKHPRGTLHDNTRHPRFVWRCERVLNRTPIRHLDLGCAGGGLVWDFTLRGHQSVGLEGSDLSLRERRAEWRLIPDRLFTADIRHPFSFRNGDGEAVAFDVVTAWELFEHIDTAAVDDLLESIRLNLREDGILVASISKVDDRDAATGVSWHKTIQDDGWWHARLDRAGFEVTTADWDVGDFVRGVGNPRASDWDVRSGPATGFHVVATRRKG